MVNLIPLLLGGASLASLYKKYGKKISKTADDHKKWKEEINEKEKLKKLKEKEKGDDMSDNWIQGAVKKPGALRATAEREGLIEGDEKLSGTDLKKLAAQASKTDNKKLAQRVNLAKTFSKMRKAEGGEVEIAAAKTTPIHKPVPVTPQDVLRTKKEGDILGKEMESDADIAGVDDEYKDILEALKRLDREPSYKTDRS